MPHHSFDPTASSKDMKGAIKRLLRMLRHDRGRIVLIALMLLVFAAGTTLAPLLLGLATNIIVDGVAAGTGIDFTALGMMLLWVILAYAISNLADFISGIYIRIVVQDLGYRLRRKAQEKIDRLSLGYIDSHQRGDLISRVTNDIDNITQTLLQTLNNVLASVFMIIGVLGMMFWLSWSLALLSLAVFPLGMVALVFVLKKSKPQFRAQWKLTGEVSAIVEESFTGHEVVSAYGLEEDFADVFGKSNYQLFDSGFKGQFYSQLAMPIMGFISNISFVVIAVIGGYLALSGRITIGGIQAFIHYSKQLNSPISTIAQVANLIQSGAASSERIFEFLDSAEMEADNLDNQGENSGARAEAVALNQDFRQTEASDAVQMEAKLQEQMVSDNLAQTSNAHGGAVSFAHVNFSYQPGKPIIKDFSLQVQPGQQVAIVGPTGAGKTTLINLLLRFYEIDSGEIRLDGLNIRQMTKDELRARMGIVLQDTWLFEGTIRENLAFGADNPSDEQIVAAAKATGVDRLIRQLPEGYETQLGENDTSLSAGEKQLLTIARAYISQPDILILDEATSSVDTRTEMLVQNAMNELRIGRTSFIIAHRLSTIRDADLIIVMVDGDVVEQGTHESLLAAGGTYANLYQSQFSGAEADFDTLHDQSGAPHDEQAAAR